jgi:hypothetical protein
LDQLAAPLVDAQEVSPRAPPSGQRSCWDAPVISAGFIGFTATCGSTSALSYAVAKSAEAPNAQPVSVLAPLTFTTGPRLYGEPATLTAPVAGAGRLSFDLWYDTEETDIGALETSPDGTTWTAAPISLRSGRNAWTSPGTFSGFEGRRWLKATATLPAGTNYVRWRYTTDPLYQGRGVYVDGVRAWNADGHLVFDGERPADAARFQATGWTPSTD